MNVSKISKYLQKCYCSVAELCPTLCGLMDWSTPGFPVLHHPWSLFKFMSIESVMPSNHLIFCPLLLLPSIFPSIRVYSKSRIFALGGQSIGASASALVLPVNIQDWFPLELTRLISLQSKQLSWVFSSTTIQKHQFFRAQPSLWFSFHIYTWLLEKHSFDYMDLCWQSAASAF